MRLRGHTGRAPAIALGLIVAIALIGCGGAASGNGDGAASTPTSAGARGATVTIKDYAFDSPTLTVKAGTTVTWTNRDAVMHTVTAADSLSTDAAPTGLFDAQLGQGQSFSFTFAEPGTYYYLCTPHRSMATMHATIIVQ